MSRYYVWNTFSEEEFTNQLNLETKNDDQFCIFELNSSRTYFDFESLIEKLENIF